MTEAMDSELKKGYARLVKHDRTVLERRSDFFKLKTKQIDRVNAERCSHRLGGWRQMYKIQKEKDVSVRPSDQQYFARIYTRIDHDVWDRPEMAAWYQKNARPIPRESVDSEATGYLVKLPEPKPSASRATLSHAFAAVPKPLAPEAAAPHWMDYEGNLEAQSKASKRYLSKAHNFPPPRPVVEGASVERVSGFRPAPWKDRPEPQLQFRPAQSYPNEVIPAHPSYYPLED
mmetsp:Transcript_29875/g.67013  ORF Transcript_29875/g.67013 Transcript_29875/m.67013 type:complete len:231 (-) Transcript_29875:317-1009(-)